MVHLPSIGPLYLMFTRLASDVLKFLAIVSIVLIAFSGALYRNGRAAQTPDAHQLEGQPQRPHGSNLWEATV